MKKVVTIIIAIMIFTSGCKLSLSNIPGDIIMSNPNSDDLHPTIGALLFTPQNQNYLYIEEMRYMSNMVFSANKDNVMGIKGDSTIVEYNFNKKESNVIFQESYMGTFSSVKYVPNTDYISFVAGYKDLYLLNKKSMEKTFVAKIFGEYSWSYDGKTLYYGDSGKIYKWEISNKKSVEFCDGGQPQLSNNNDLLAFFDRDILLIRDLKSGKEWKYNGKGVYYYKFSPDDKYLAIIQENTSLKYLYGQEMKIWDYGRNKKNKIIKHISDGCYSNFDWK